MRTQRIRIHNARMTKKSVRKPTAADDIRALCKQAGVSDPRVAIITIAQRLVCECEKKTPPFDPFELCKLKKVEVSEQYLVDCAARLLPVPGGYVAEVNRNDSKQRKNFSICHEIAHTFLVTEQSDFLEDGIKCNSDDSKEVRFREYLCNLGAAEMLMPRHCFVPVASSYPPSLASLRKVAETFQVSLEAAASRILQLDVWKCCHLYFSAKRGADGGLELKLAGARLSASLARNALAAAAFVLEMQNLITKCPLSGDVGAMLRGEKSVYHTFSDLHMGFRLQGYRADYADETRYCMLVSAQTDDCALATLTPCADERQMKLEFF